MTEKCKKCKFWEKLKGEEEEAEGICHRWPPYANEPFHAFLPITKPKQWCGEYQEKT